MSTDAKGHCPSALDKWLLVRYKKYATVEEIPNTISSITMKRIHDRARVHLCFILMGLSGIGMFSWALIGKYQAKKGYSIEQRAEDLINRKSNS
ncbi:mitochondrial import receptor subunit TOM6 [Sarcoptes scabiei]|uniref:DUF1075 domain containing protein n=1 Tax=Sarcoptes scabiei TaxID=52283 RepID=A0A132A0F2_SARSC|nr:DUF1075 domain containing protein [Sarcoptes scabiei]UXI22743.1 mitochondrial import receptor subunit TOM6 [Sarcoptes scabiei]